MPKKKPPTEKKPPSLSPAERLATGKAMRTAAPRSSHGDWKPAADRRDPVETLQEQAKTRVPELVPIRYGRMLVSAFTFYRGAAAIQAADLAPTPRSGPWVQLCGDAHLSNFGGFAAPDRDLVFDINDFDETLPGPWEWDVKRLAASLAIAGRDRGIDRKARATVLLEAIGAYRNEMAELASQRNLDVWYTRLDASAIQASWGGAVTKKDQKAVQRNVAKARAKDSMRALSKLTHRVDGELRIISDPPLIVPAEEVAEGAGGHVEELVDGYRSSLPDNRRHLFDTYRFVHAARKVVGVGSVGTEAWIALFLGRDDGDPLFLQLKEAQQSVLEPYTAPSSFKHQGQRVVEGQTLVQAASDIFLGWLTATGAVAKGRHFYVRQLWDQKTSADVDRMSPELLIAYAQICGATLARAHARSGDRIVISGYLGRGSTFDRAIAAYAEAYADQNEKDYAEVQAAVGDGRITAQTGL